MPAISGIREISKNATPGKVLGLLFLPSLDYFYGKKVPSCNLSLAFKVLQRRNIKQLKTLFDVYYLMPYLRYQLLNYFEVLELVVVWSYSGGRFFLTFQNTQHIVLVLEAWLAKHNLLLLLQKATTAIAIFNEFDFINVNFGYFKNCFQSVLLIST